MAGFFIGLFLGGSVGFVAYALLTAGSDADDTMEDMETTTENEKEGKPNE